MKSSMNWLKSLALYKKLLLGAGTLVVLAAATPHHPANMVPPPSTPPEVKTTALSTLPEAPKITVVTQIETKPIPFSKTTVQDASSPKGQSNIKTVGVDGVSTLTYETTSSGGQAARRRLIKTETTTGPITEVTAVGTYEAPVAAAPAPNNCDPNYSPCIPYYAGNALNCPDIGIRVRVIGVDHNRFDADGDGYGCDSY